MNNYKNLPQIVLAFIFMVASISATAQVKGNGNVKSENRTVDSFSSIKLTSSADLTIKQGSASVIVSTDENLLELIKTEVENDVLYIGVNGRRGYRSSKGVHVEVTIPNLEKLINSGSGDIEIKSPFKGSDLYVNINGSGDLEADIEVKNLELKINGSGDSEISGVMGVFEIHVSGSGDINADNLKLEQCYVRNSGSGDISLEGKTNTLTVNQNGSGDLNAYNLVAVDATVANSGSSDISLNIVESLKVTLNGSGDVVYRGNPKNVDVRTNGSGEVYKK